MSVAMLPGQFLIMKHVKGQYVWLVEEKLVMYKAKNARVMNKIADLSRGRNVEKEALRAAVSHSYNMLLR